MISKTNEFVIGYFNIRGKAQVPRLLCERFNVPYINQFYTPKQYMEEKQKNPKFSLPFLKKGDEIIYGPQLMSYFILIESNNEQILGKTQVDKVKIKMYCWSIDSIASIIAANSTKILEERDLDKQWQKNLKLKLQKYDIACGQNDEWFLGYLTLIDFSVYELVRYMDWMFPGKMKNFKNLCRIKRKVQMLPEIKAYESSPDCVKQISPVNILKEISNLSPVEKDKKKK